MPNARYQRRSGSASPRAWRLPALAIVLLLSTAACGNIAPSPAPASAAADASTPAPAPATASAPAPTASDAWQVAELAQPSAVTSAPSLPAGFQCHPCHFLAENQLFGIAPSAAGLIAVGVQEPPVQAVAFASSDGANWAPIAGFTGADGTTAIAVTSAGGRTVIVGSDHAGATSWASTGGPWTQAPVQADLAVPYAAGQMTAVIPFAGGFLAGGYRDDPLHASASAAVWRSDDGLTWHVDDGSGAFAGGRISSLAATGGTIVAVGTSGDPSYGPAAAWRWTQATGWQRATIGPNDGGAMRGVTATGAGYVAVGLNGHDDGAMTWTSSDGLTWTAAPDQPAFRYFALSLRMQSVVAGPAGLVAGGWRSDAGKGSAVTWTSADGVTWKGPTWQSSFSGGQITGLAVAGSAVVAVGREGYPDWNQAAIWVRPNP